TVMLHPLVEEPQVVGADLMTKAARAAVKHHTDLAGLIDVEGTRRLAVVHALGMDHLDLQVVVARAERAQLVHAARAGSRAHVRGIRAVEAASSLAAVQIRRPAEPMGHAPA